MTTGCIRGDKMRAMGYLLRRIREVEERRGEFYRTSWKSWYDRVIPLFWGILGSRSMIFEISEQFRIRGLSMREADSSVRERTLIVLDEELPLLIGREGYDVGIVEGRLKGHIQGIPKRQDLVDGYRRLSIRGMHQNRVLGMCQEKVCGMLPRVGMSTRLIVIEGGYYVFVTTKGEYHFLNCGEVYHIEDKL
jgi:hypothetical protein